MTTPSSHLSPVPGPDPTSTALLRAAVTLHSSLDPVRTSAAVVEEAAVLSGAGRVALFTLVGTHLEGRNCYDAASGQVVAAISEEEAQHAEQVITAGAPTRSDGRLGV